MAFASSLFCSSKFLEHTHSNQTPHCACMFGQHQGRTYPFRFRFLAHFNLMLDFFLCQNIGWKYRRGSNKNTTIIFFFFFCWAHFFAPPSEWRPRRPPIPPVGKTAPAHTYKHTHTSTHTPTHTHLHTQYHVPVKTNRPPVTPPADPVPSSAPSSL